MPACFIDHITILSPTLAAGAQLVQARLGVQPQGGGRHPRMGTHNLLLRLGDAVFLEVIAVDPAAPRPARARWFELDRLAPDSEPRLGCWVARTPDIHASLAQAAACLGNPEPMSRGTLDWLISIPADGSLPMSGAAPALIQWRTGAHPAGSMDDQGCTLVTLELLHPEPDRLRAVIDSLHFADAAGTLSVAEAAAPGLVATIDTPRGVRTIGAARPV